MIQNHKKNRGIREQKGSLTAQWFELVTFWSIGQNLNYWTTTVKFLQTVDDYKQVIFALLLTTYTSQIAAIGEMEGRMEGRKKSKQ